MNTPQNNSIDSPPTLGKFTLTINCGMDAELVRSALLIKRAKLIEQATHLFAAHNAQEYLYYCEFIESIDSLIDQMFDRMNDALDQAGNGKYKEVRERDRLDEFERAKTQVLDDMNRIHLEAFGI